MEPRGGASSHKGDTASRHDLPPLNRGGIRFLTSVATNSSPASGPETDKPIVVAQDQDTFDLF
jgi:hypothetical protein